VSPATAPTISSRFSQGSSLQQPTRSPSIRASPDFQQSRLAIQDTKALNHQHTFSQIQHCWQTPTRLRKRTLSLQDPIPKGETRPHSQTQGPSNEKLRLNPKIQEGEREPPASIEPPQQPKLASEQTPKQSPILVISIFNQGLPLNLQHLHKSVQPLLRSSRPHKCDQLLSSCFEPIPRSKPQKNKF